MTRNKLFSAVWIGVVYLLTGCSGRKPLTEAEARTLVHHLVTANNRNDGGGNTGVDSLRILTITETDSGYRVRYYISAFTTYLHKRGEAPEVEQGEREVLIKETDRRRYQDGP